MHLQCVEGHLDEGEALLQGDACLLDCSLVLQQCLGSGAVDVPEAEQPDLPQVDLHKTRRPLLHIHKIPACSKGSCPITCSHSRM